MNKDIAKIIGIIAIAAINIAIAIYGENGEASLLACFSLIAITTIAKSK